MRVPLCVLLLSAWVVGLLAPEAAAAPKKRKESWVIILGGGKEPKDGEQALQAFQQRSPTGIQWAEGYPKVLVSKSLPGLNPGFHIAVVGFCPDKARATEVTRWLNDTLGGGVYFKKTSGDFDGLCPEVVKDPAPEGYELEREVPVAASGPDAKRSWFIYKSLPTADLPKDECETPRYVIQVREGLKVLAEEQLDTRCRKGSEEPEDHDYGESTEWTLSVLKLDGVNVLWTKETRNCCDDSFHTHALLAFGCDNLVRQDLGSHGEFADPSRMSVEVTRSEDGEHDLVRTSYTENPGDAEPDEKEYTWSPKACAFE